MLSSELSKSIVEIIEDWDEFIRIKFSQGEVIIELGSNEDWFRLDDFSSFYPLKIYKALYKCIDVITKFSEGLNSIDKISLKTIKKEVNIMEDTTYDHLIDL